VLPNSEEAELLIENQNTVPYELLQKLLRKFSIVGLKLGAKGSLCGIKTNEKIQKISSQLTSKIAYAPAKKIASIVDSTGCGDAWNAAFLHHLLEGTTLKNAASEANVLAAWVLRHSGATPPRRA
jgi:sugar/nucleoside kinase (ribokinase family)